VSALASVRALRSLAENEAAIERGVLGYVEAGMALADIRDRRLYRDQHPTFEAYCRQRWGFARRTAYQLIDAAGVVSVLCANAHIPSPRSEGVARELVPLRDTPDRLRETWAATVEKHGPDPTAKQVRAIINAGDERRRVVRPLPDNAPRPPITLAPWEDWLPDQPDCDLLLTDPPYSTDVEDIETFAQAWLPAALAKVKPTGRAFVCIGAYPRELAAYLAVPAPAHLQLEQVLVWTYRNTLGPSPAHRFKANWQAILYYVGAAAPPLHALSLVELFSVVDISAPDGRHGNRWHAWQKPDELGERFVRLATEPGGLVLDPFAGTGSFLLAAARLGRLAAGCDNTPAMVLIAQERGCHAA